MKKLIKRTFLVQEKCQRNAGKEAKKTGLRFYEIFDSWCTGKFSDRNFYRNVNLVFERSGFECRASWLSHLRVCFVDSDVDRMSARNFLIIAILCVVSTWFYDIIDSTFESTYVGCSPLSVSASMILLKLLNKASNGNLNNFVLLLFLLLQQVEVSVERFKFLFLMWIEDSRIMSCL